ncbi:DMT family transporter [Fimbriimonas ginsengisoli]|uniref:Permease of the drug/metabolite transporter (DMT) superfamily n=1 Tax=Fimbriimonas ginsengisoli Gsoil 348 TaxID=661478 RepID=A0A068NQW8_FIMGI|nr:DMT family transporter [Fimbriimonas ginsengisoli]AIE85130.1 Permease of the drug/metabolite transporter (DMT) superfamily [Fimbriimonas ginsengisoli Gsoil 348]
MRFGRADALLTVITMVWGGTFLVAKLALAHIGPFGFLATRFTIGAVVLAAFTHRRLRGLTKLELQAGIATGLAVFAAYGLQTVGLGYTTSSKSAFLTAMYVPLVPILQLALFGRRPSLAAGIGATVSFVGLGLLSLKPGAGFALGLGEWLTLASAVACAIQILLISKHAEQADPIRLGVVQLAFVAALSLMTMPFVGEVLPSFSPSLIAVSVGMGVLGTAFALAGMNWAQRTVPATRAALLYAMEPIWAGLVGAAVGEELTKSALAGSFLIIAGTVIAEVKLRDLGWLGGLRARVGLGKRGPAHRGRTESLLEDPL